MADNFNATPGSGYVFAAEDIDDILHTRIKIQSGVAGAANDVSIDDPLPVAISGLAQVVTRTHTTSADMTTAAAITDAPTSGEKIVATDIIVSTDTQMHFAIQEETSDTVFAAIYLAADSTAQISLHGYIKAEVADKKLMGKASESGNVAITVIWFSET